MTRKDYSLKNWVSVIGSPIPAHFVTAVADGSLKSPEYADPGQVLILGFPLFEDVIQHEG